TRLEWFTFGGLIRSVVLNQCFTMSLKTFFVSFLLFVSTLSLQAQNHKISGYIREAGSRESLVGAAVIDLKSLQGAASNPYGFYSLTLPAGEVSLQCSYIGYETQRIAFELKADTVVEIFLKPLATQLKEVVVSSRRSKLETTQLGAIHVPVSQLTAIPSLLGETDIMKSIQMLPGIEASDEGKSDFSVRGGSPDQNLIMLDGIPVYNTSHVFGFLSIFNSDAIKNVNIYKGGFPARYGGRLSSVLDIRTNDGNMEQLHGTASVGLLSMKAALEGPLVKDKTSFNISYRRTYVDLFMGAVLDRLRELDEYISERDDYNFFFYDVNAKLHHKINEKSGLFFMFYNGRDKLDTQYDTRDGYTGELSALTEQDWKWGSTIAAAKWNYIFSGNLFLNTTFSYNNYMYDMHISKTYESYYDENVQNRSYVGANYNSGIVDYSLTADLDFIPSPQHYVRMGTALTYHNFKPEVLSQQSSEEHDDFYGYDFQQGRRIHAYEAALYAEDDWSITPRFKVNPGLRFSLFHVERKTYAALDPRFSMNYRLTKNLSLKAGYTHMKQYIHMLSSNIMFLQTDLWVPVTKKVKPMNSHQYSVGLFADLPHGLELSAEAYYKDMRNVLEYEDGASLLGLSAGWESKVEAGQGRSYGLELFLQRTTGKTTGWLGYTWAKTERRFDDINFGEWFPAKYDRRHSINLSVIQQLGKHFEVSGNWVFSSGNVITLPMKEIKAAEIPDTPFTYYMPVEQFDHRNNYRLDPYHRLDLGVSYYTSRTKKRYSIWNLSLYNAYNQMNPFLVTTDFKDDPYYGEKRVLKKITLFPVIPSISYTYKF
ncbi:TonB-dependent receptor, partial [Parabacteroides sp. OttesenSCG-928-K15]|nr:TonB-dependent receptor [Parabacteroides sp. OttesenSCG-928-K15]